MHQYPLIHPCVSRKLTDFSVVLTVFFGCSEKFSYVSSTYKKADTVARYVERMLSLAAVATVATPAPLNKLKASE